MRSTPEEGCRTEEQSGEGTAEPLPVARESGSGWGAYRQARVDAKFGESFSVPDLADHDRCPPHGGTL
jgi:hypothetical protein